MFNLRKEKNVMPSSCENKNVSALLYLVCLQKNEDIFGFLRLLIKSEKVHCNELTQLIVRFHRLASILRKKT